jgi:2-polyprenyl-3-methyl-5-hydroxy-6-metoxy-1,4-benzoquinol methylase
LSYDASAAAAFYGEREWERFERAGMSSSLASHLHYLRRFVTAGERVLDVGCGPGRFTIDLARIGARVVAADISPAQLELHRRYIGEAVVCV